jgi:isopenicillin-N N-acyltransferase-like protein
MTSEAPRVRARRMRRLLLSGPPDECGRAHGAAFRDEIRRYTEERVRLSMGGSWAGRPATRGDVLGLAGSMLAAHRSYAPDLCQEMEAMADAAGITAAEAVVVGGFTDFVDTLRGRTGEAPDEDDCTAVLTPDSRSGGAGFLAQTWDMHDSATEHVLMLDVRAEASPRAYVFSTVGCLGQIGMNEAGIAIGINNLAAAVGRAGVTWPFVVRKALQQDTIEDALACVTDPELAGAHNYLLRDRHGRGFNVEAMPEGSHVEELGDVPLHHSNHCLHAEMLRYEASRAPGLMESSQRRLARAHELLDDEPTIDLEMLFDLTRDPRAICQRATPPFHIESSGAVVMRPASGDLWAVWGIPAENEYEHFGFGSDG